MRVLLTSFGTRGDIQPYAAFAGALANAGHEVTLAIPEQMADLVPDAGRGRITLRPTGTEMMRLLQEVMPELSGPRDALKTFGIMRDAMRRHLDETWEAAQQQEADGGAPDVVVHHSKCQGAPHIAEKFGVPAVLSLPLPFYTPTAAHPAPFFGNASFGARGNRATYAVGRLGNVTYAGMLSDFREKIGLSGRVGRFDDPLMAPDGSAVHLLYPYSRHVLPVPADYPPTAHVTGFWFLDRDEALTEEVEAFLDAGDAPVYLGFGSMGFGKGAEQRRDAVLGALAETGLRGIVATGWGGIAQGSAPSDDVLMVEGAAHDRLFPRCAAVVHHGGAGSVAAGLRAGRPTLISPFLGDQPFWAARLRELGVGPAPVPPKRLGTRLAARLGELVGTPAYASRAAAVGERIRNEDGLGNGVRALERIVGV